MYIKRARDCKRRGIVFFARKIKGKICCQWKSFSFLLKQRWELYSLWWTDPCSPVMLSAVHASNGLKGKEYLSSGQIAPDRTRKAVPFEIVKVCLTLIIFIVIFKTVQYISYRSYGQRVSTWIHLRVELNWVNCTVIVCVYNVCIQCKCGHIICLS